MADITRSETTKDDHTEFEKFKNLTSRLLNVNREELRSALQQDREDHAGKKAEREN